MDANGRSFIELKKSTTSPYLKFTVADETPAQRNILIYWTSKGFAVRSEGVDFLRETDFAGFQPLAWWFSLKPHDYLNYPASYYKGGVNRSEWGKNWLRVHHTCSSLKFNYLIKKR